MNMYSSQDRVVLIPLPKSPAAARRCKRRRFLAGDERRPQPKPGGRRATAESAGDEPDLERVGGEHRAVRRSEVVVAAALGAGGRLRRRGPDRAVGGRHLQRPRANDLGAVRRRIEASSSCTRRPGDDRGDDGELADRHRPQELVGDAGDRQALAGQLLERAHQQRGRRAAVLSAGIPRPARQFGGDRTSPSWTKTATWARTWPDTVAPGYTQAG